jgi:probable O-glycosylation ligase (exosortase A-associated)
MRDLILTAFVFGTIPFILRNPYYGLLMWVWLGIMNPHRLTWGFAYSLPFAQVIAICTLLSVLINTKKLYRFPSDWVAIFLFVLVVWIGVSPLFSFHPDKELEMWLKPIKILFMTLLALLIIGNRDQLHKLVWVLALSIGFFGIKGGIFTIVSGGSYRVWGPAGSFIEENNALALATIMTIPLFRYLQLHNENLWVKRGCIAAMTLCLFSALGSYSRGALLAIVAMGAFLFLKSRQKGLVLVLLLVLAPIAIFFMPEQWLSRMSTIQAYEQDGSALGRINAWWMAWNLAMDRFPIGGGFAIYEPDVFQLYAPDPLDLHAAHSIYFQILGEHGFIGLALFLSIFGLTWRNAGWVMRNTKNRVGWEWAYDLAALSQVSLAGYAVGGAFLSLTYFDLPYYIVVILIVTRGLVARDTVTTQSNISKTVPA